MRDGCTCVPDATACVVVCAGVFRRVPLGSPDSSPAVVQRPPAMSLSLTSKLDRELSTHHTCCLTPDSLK